MTRTESAKRITLQNVAYEIQLMDLMSQVIVTQTYMNAGEQNIEAVFTFPLPVDAVLLDLHVALGEKKLEGVVIEKAEATEQYEDAVIEGDTAVLLEQVEPGLYTMNCGNILSGETAEITFRYAELFSWQGNQMRFFLPTTLAPRYGDPEAGGLASYQVPVVDLMTENTCEIRVEVCGRLAAAEYDSPSHAIVVQREEYTAHVHLGESRTLMDRDFVLNIKAEEAEKTFALWEEDGEHFAVWTSFQPQWELDEESPPRSAKVVVDCSGSMAGDSAAQARQALARILEELRPQDWFNIIRFGSQTETLFDKQVEASPTHLRQALMLLARMDADMGGTEIGEALETAFRSEGPADIVSDVLLITDGEIWDAAQILEKARVSEHRVFTVGVGSSVAEAFLKDLARQTGGRCELVVPGEGMAEQIVRHFRRIYTPGTLSVNLQWPGEEVEELSVDSGPVYSGETVHAFARCQDMRDEEVVCQVQLTDGRMFSHRTALEPFRANRQQPDKTPSTLARLGVARLLREGSLEDEEAQKLAVQHQLLSLHTGMLVVVQRAKGEKPEELPELHQVAQMLAAGWGGIGTVSQNESMVHIDVSMPLRDTGFEYGVEPSPPLFMRKASVDIADPALIVGGMSGEFVQRLCQYLSLGGLSHGVPNLRELAELGLYERALIALKDLVDDDHPEEEVLLIFLHLFVLRLPSGELNRNIGRLLRKQSKSLIQSENWIRPIKKIESLLD